MTSRATLGGALVAIAMVALPARADEPVACSVTIEDAPDAVRAEIDAWVRAEPRCDTELDIVVTPTADGLQLVATDREGHARERVVPDARSAALLVVSWMADDSIAGVENGAPADDSGGGLTSVAVAAPDAGPRVRSPIAMRGESLDEIPRAAWRPSSVIVGASAGTDTGVRAQIDLFARGPWRLGVAGGGSERAGAQGRAVIGARWAHGRWSVRAQLGFGVDVNDGEHGDGDGDSAVARRAEGHGDPVVMPAFDAAVLGGVRVHGAWRLVAGPLAGGALVGEDAGLGIGAFVGIEREGAR